MLVPAITGAIILLATVAYVIFRKFSITRQAIEFAAPQNGVAVGLPPLYVPAAMRVRCSCADGA